MKDIKELKNIKHLIKIWNDEHVDIFKIDNPDKNNIFGGVVKLYYFDRNEEIQSRCLRIANTSTSVDVIKRFIQKNDPKKQPQDYSIYTVFPNGGYIFRLFLEYNILEKTNFPLLVQLSWAETILDGRFLLRDHWKTPKIRTDTITDMPKNYRKNKNSTEAEFYYSLPESIEQNINELFKKIPSTPMNSGINNQAEVLKRQRQQILAKKIQEFLDYELQHGINQQNRDDKGGPPKLGTIKIFISSIFPDTSYKTIMISVYDNARNVIGEVLNKIRASKIELKETNFFLTMLIMPNLTDKKSGKHLKKTTREYCILDDDYPLLLHNRYSIENSKVAFHLRRKILPDLTHNLQIVQEARDFMLEKKYFAVLCALVVKNTACIPPDHPSYIALNRDIVAIGNNSYNLNAVQVFGQNPTRCIVLSHSSIHPLHCAISGLNGVLSLVPLALGADIRIDGNQIYETTTLMDGNKLTIGATYFFQVFIQNKISAETAQIYWKSFQTKIEDSSSPKIPIKEEILHIEDVCLPLYLKFNQDYFELIYTKILKLLSYPKIKFKLSVAYLLYLVFCGQFDNIIQSNQQIDKSCLKEFTRFCKVSSKIVDEAIFYNNQELEVLLIWLGNISEFLYFLKRDISLNLVTNEVQDFCEYCIRVIINEITRKLEEYISNFIDSFYSQPNSSDDILKDLNSIINFDPSSHLEDINKIQPDTISIQSMKRNYLDKFIAKQRPPIISDVMHCFNEWLGLFCMFQINTSFTAQIFLRLFNYMCKYLVDKIIITINPDHENEHNLVDTLKSNLEIFFLWSESQGLEPIANKYFYPISKLLEFLLAKIENLKDLKTAITQCDALNSQQFSSLFNKWDRLHTKSKLKQEWKNEAIEHARMHNDTKNSMTGNIKLEYQNLAINSCFITSSGYSSEAEQEVANILYKIIKELNLQDIQIMKSQENHSHWNCRFIGESDNYTFTDKKAEYMFITIQKESQSFLGIRILAIKNSKTGNSGIYISHIEDNTAAKKDGRLTKGDQLISANDISLVGVTQKEAVDILLSCGNLLKLEVLKNSAKLHGLEELLTDKKYWESQRQITTPKPLHSRSGSLQKSALSIYSDGSLNKNLTSKIPSHSSALNKDVLTELKCHKLVNKETITKYSTISNSECYEKKTNVEQIKREKEYENLILMFKEEKISSPAANNHHKITKIRTTSQNKHLVGEKTIP
ncbi:hypothetical protein HZS_4727, partial [Henneguya salminicola]